MQGSKDGKSTNLAAVQRTAEHPTAKSAQSNANATPTIYLMGIVNIN